MEILILLGALGIILLGAEAFTNSLEHFGERLGISEGVTGSIFAAVGTALPETMVPLFAILLGTGSETLRHEVAVGAILGAPPEPRGFARDLVWFNWAFFIGVLATFVPQDWPGVRGVMAFILVGMYVTYLTLTIHASTDLVDVGHGTEADHPLYLMKIGLPDNLLMILFQLVL